MSDERSVPATPSSRRDFLKASAVAAAGVGLGSLAHVHADSQDTLKIGLIGCGGRGTGAADNCLSSSPGVKLIALADLFGDRLEGAQKHLANAHKDKVDLPAERCFVGLDAYKHLLATDIDLVLLATPPGFRPQQIEAAVAAGKHIFTEKPVATDAPGIRRVLAAAVEAKKKNLATVAGTQRRHQTGYLETIKRLHDGAIGNIVAGRCYWNQGALWSRKREDLKDLEWQVRNWLYFTWLSGDHICEQHVHNLDVINWALQAHPVRAVGMGGRQVRTEAIYGNVFDHFAIDYEYPNGVHVLSMCRQIDGCANSVSEAVVGTKGSCDLSGYRITGEPNWHFDKKDNSPYVQEHTDLIASIRKGEPLQELQTVAESTLTAILGRMSTYTGRALTWEQALNSKDELVPKDITLDMRLPIDRPAVPGFTPFI